MSHYITERDEEIDIIEANMIFNIFLQEVAFNVYNKAIDDAKELFKKQIENINIDLEVLKN